jgi:hypothetical protein
MTVPTTFQFGHLSAEQKERLDATVALGARQSDLALSEFQRAARELSGSDQVLYRVLLGRLIDAYHRGQSDAGMQDHYYRFGHRERMSP